MKPSSTTGAPPGTAASWRPGLLAVVLLLAIGGLAYANSFGAPFVFDDLPNIVGNARLHRWPPWPALLGTTRPVVMLSLALNYAAGGLDPSGYHALNLLIHLAAALTLFGVVRRTLGGPASTWPAAVIALLWVAHPLQTESVTYVIQRAESLMGWCYLLTLYGVIRAAGAPASAGWPFVSLIACAVGMGSKPVMVTAPLAVLLYDRVFLSGSFAGALRARGRLYTLLALTWLVPVVGFVHAPQEYALGGAFAKSGLSPLEYAQTQPGVILHYLRLAIWPHPLVLDYAWPVARTMRQIVPPALAIGALLLGIAWAWRRRPALGYLGVWCALILVPTSSVFPLEDPAFEHRMYLPLAALITLGVLGARRLLAALVPADARRQSRFGMALAAVAVAASVSATIRRNADYRSELAIYADILATRPGNARAHNSLGFFLHRQGQLDEAIAQYREAIRLRPDYANARNNLGAAYAAQGKLDDALAQYAEALRIKPGDAAAHNNLGLALARHGHPEESIVQFAEALRLDPGNAQARANLARAHADRARLDRLMPHIKRVR